MMLSFEQKMYGIPTWLYRNEMKFAYLYYPRYIFRKYVSPTGGNASGSGSSLTIRKSFSEWLERSSLFQITTERYHKQSVFDLISNEVVEVKSSDVGYSTMKENASDSTGTAFHPCGNDALIKAISELIEKNSAFVFWFGSQGVLIPNEYVTSIVSSNMCKILISSHIKYKVFEGPQIGIIRTVICFLYDSNDKLISSGVSGSFKVQEAITNAILEALTLFWNRMRNNIGYSFQYSKKHIDFIETKSKGSIFDDQSFCQDYTIDNIVGALPCWIKHLNVLLLPRTSFYPVRGVEVYSSDLYNCLPQQEFIDLSRAINLNTINLDQRKLLSLPDMPLM